MLACFLGVRGLVPAGFMPAAVADGAPYGYCHGDSRSALLLNALAQYHHDHHSHAGEHDHDDATAQAFADNHCGFSAGSGVAPAPTLHIPRLATAPSRLPATIARSLPRQRSYLHPPSRAPPLSRFA